MVAGKLFTRCTSSERYAFIFVQHCCGLAGQRHFHWTEIEKKTFRLEISVAKWDSVCDVRWANGKASFTLLKPILIRNRCTIWNRFCIPCVWTLSTLSLLSLLPSTSSWMNDKRRCPPRCMPPSRKQSSTRTISAFHPLVCCIHTLYANYVCLSIHLVSKQNRNLCSVQCVLSGDGIVFMWKPSGCVHPKITWSIDGNKATVNDFEWMQRVQCERIGVRRDRILEKYKNTTASCSGRWAREWMAWRGQRKGTRARDGCRMRTNRASIVRTNERHFRVETLGQCHTLCGRRIRTWPEQIV